jgi:hypothetical protein
MFVRCEGTIIQIRRIPPIPHLHLSVLSVPLWFQNLHILHPPRDDPPSPISFGASILNGMLQIHQSTDFFPRIVFVYQNGTLPKQIPMML